MTRTARITAAYAFCHFVVDLASVTTVLGLVAPHLASRGPKHVALAFLAYDLVAFCCQLPLGVQTRMIDGSKYILIRADEGVEVNGVNIAISGGTDDDDAPF